MRSYDSLRITVDDTDKDSLMNMVRQTLDSGIPAIAAKTSHAMTLIGYDKEKQTVTIWDQRMPNMKKRDDLPMGAQELSEAAFRSRIADVMLFKPIDSRVTAHPLGESTGGEVHKHEIINGNEREETLAKFLCHAAEPRIAAELRRKHRVFVPDGGNFIELTGEPDKNGWPCRNAPDGKPEIIKQTAIERMLEITGGAFYSSRPKDGS